MPIGAAIGAAGALGAGATVAASSKNASAIDKSTQTQTQANRESLALTREIYDENKAVLGDFVQTGLPATKAANALLGIGTSTPDYNAYLSANPDVMQGYYQTADKGQFSSPEEYARWHYQNYGAGEKRALPTNGMTQEAANKAFADYRNSTGYDFRVNEGLRAINSGFAGRGVLQSGAAMRAINDYGQNMASAEFGSYFDRIADQQRLGLSAASAQAGVGQNFANNASALNTSNANALAQGAVAKANNSNALISGLGGIAGNTISGLGTSFGRSPGVVAPGVSGFAVNALTPYAASTIAANPGIF